jgi:hypothetical protein
VSSGPQASPRGIARLGLQRSLRGLEARGVEISKHLHRGLNLCPDAEELTRFLERAVTATREADLVTEEPSLRPSHGS